MATWYILSDIPYQKEFPAMPSAPVAPERPYDWYILNDIPYRKEFPEMPEAPVAPPITYDWYILNDIPYRKEFPELLKLSHKPEYPKLWYILEDIPYIKTYVDVIGLSAKPDYPRIWYILEDIPYIKDYPQVLGLSAKPDYPRIWYILEDIPYIKDYPEVLGLSAKPNYPRIWWIDTDIPYIKEYPDVIPLSRKPDYPRIWYILDDIPYLKEYPPMYYMEPLPVEADWYILYDIPYRKEFPPLYELSPLPVPEEPWYYVVGVAAVGRWQVRKTRMSEPISPPEEWTLIEDLGPPSAVLSACIEADGDFDYIAGNDSITLTTTDTPWLAVITTTKKLYVKQVCADIETAILLDTGVEQASLCRGWKSDKYSVDSGLICAYRKSNGVYAKVYKKVSGEYVWETLPQLLYEPVEHVEVKRLNDYRIGVYVTNPNRLLLSERFYIGGTSKTEYIYTKMVSWVNIATARMNTEPAHQDFTFVSATIENQKYIRVHGKYPIYSIDRDVTNVTFNDSYKHSKMVSYTINNGDILIEMDNPKLNAWNTLSITFTTYNHIKYVAGESRTGVVPEQTITVPNDFVPKEYINLTMGSAVSELKTVEMQNYKISMPKEMISMSMSSTVSELITTEVQRKQYNAKTETIILSMNSAVSELQTTQVGDLPV